VAGPLALIDSHCHIDLNHFDGDRQAVLQRARQAGVQSFVIPGIDLTQNQQALVLAQQEADVRVAVGVHPNSSGDFGPQSLEQLEFLANHPHVVAIGEIGLDYYWKDVEPERQASAFEAQLALAARIGKPVIIHCREANEDVAAHLRAWVGSSEFRNSALSERPFAGVLHAFPGDLALAQEAYSWGFVISLGGPVTFRNARTLHALIPNLRLDRLMLETDSPYLTPHPHRGTRNEPAYVTLVCDAIARLLGVPSETVANATTTVAQKFFGIQA
jgi:TatD DNase family protein